MTWVQWNLLSFLDFGLMSHPIWLPCDYEMISFPTAIPLDKHMPREAGSEVTPTSSHLPMCREGWWTLCGCQHTATHQPVLCCGWSPPWLCDIQHNSWWKIIQCWGSSHCRYQRNDTVALGVHAMHQCQITPAFAVTCSPTACINWRWKCLVTSCWMHCRGAADCAWNL